MTEANNEKIGGLPVIAWTNIIRQICDPDHVLNDKHVNGIMTWGRDKRTLAMEVEVLGKPESVQIWRVLEGMRCLSYDD